MPTTGLNHDDDVKQSKKTTARLHKDSMKKGADMTQVKLKAVIFHDSVDKSELPTYSTEDNDTFIDVLHNVNIMPGLDSLNLVAYRRG
jgi:hypothetical protein